MKKKFLIGAMLVAMSVVMAGCTSKDVTEDSNKPVSEDTMSGKEDNVDITDSENTDVDAAPSYSEEEIANMFGSLLDNSSFREDYIKIVNSVDENGTVVVPPYMTSQPYGTAFRTEGISGIFDASKQVGLDFSKIKKIVLPDTVTTISSSFVDLPNLEEVVLPAGLKEIHLSFRGCPNLKRVVIPEGTESIEYSFTSLHGLESVEFSGGPKKILSSFEFCSKLVNVSLPDAVEEIDSSFWNCEALKTIEFNSEKTAICGSYTFSGTPWFSDLLEKNQGSPVIVDGLLLACPVQSETFVLPSEVKCIAGCAFESKDCKVKELIIPEESKDVKFAKSALGGTLRKVVFDYYVECLEDYAFYGSDVEEVEFAKGINKIGNHVFALTYELKNVVLPEGLKEIGDYAFDDSGLEAISLPESLEVIGEHAFAGCDDLEGVVIPSKIKEIKDNTFHGCKALTSVALPDGLEKIGYMAFDNCMWLTSIVIPETVTEIGNYAFSGCEDLAEVIMPENIEIGTGAFSGCHALEQ